MHIYQVILLQFAKFFTTVEQKIEWEYLEAYLRYNDFAQNSLFKLNVCKIENHLFILTKFANIIIIHLAQNFGSSNI